jgi:hypothetical protein
MATSVRELDLTVVTAGVFSSAFAAKPGGSKKPYEGARSLHAVGGLRGGKDEVGGDNST